MASAATRASPKAKLLCRSAASWRLLILIFNFIVFTIILLFINTRCQIVTLLISRIPVFGHGCDSELPSSGIHKKIKTVSHNHCDRRPNKQKMNEQIISSDGTSEGNRTPIWKLGISHSIHWTTKAKPVLILVLQSYSLFIKSPNRENRHYYTSRYIPPTLPLTFSQMNKLSQITELLFHLTH